MKIHLIVLIVILSGYSCFSQGQSSPATNPAPDGSLDHNYVVSFQIIRDGTNSVNVKAVTAQRGFQMSLDKPTAKLSGKLFFQPDDKAYLEFEFATTNLPEVSEKRGAKSQANNQMFASLIAFVVRSTLTYDPQQNEANTNGPSAQHPTSLRSSVWLKLGRPVTLMTHDRETFKISVDRLKDGAE